MRGLIPLMAALRFEAEWRTTLLVVVLVPVLAALGFWQLSRAEEKTAISEEFERKRARPAAPLGQLTGLSPQELAYRPVALTGHFRAQEYFLQDNRLVQGRYGNEVVAVFEVDDPAMLVLVNRGWIVADPSRRTLPQAPEVSGSASIRGQVYVAPGRPYMLADEPLADGWPKRIQAVDINKAAAALEVEPENLFPYPVRINADEPGALYVDWPVINVSPAKHYGYAVQWFSMSAVLALLFLVRSTNLMALIRGGQD